MHREGAVRTVRDLQVAYSLSKELSDAEMGYFGMK
jgi:hypothetical protein